MSEWEFEKLDNSIGSSLNYDQETYLRGYARALQDVLREITGDSNCSKSYDPIDFWDGKIHSYAFDMKDGGRHHPLSDYKDFKDIKTTLLSEVIDELKQNN